MDERPKDGGRAAVTAFDPLSTFAAAQAQAARFAKDPVPEKLVGAREGQVFRWTWTFGGADGASVDVTAAPEGVKVAWHGNRTYVMDPGQFDPKAIKIDPEKVAQLVGAGAQIETLILQSNRATGNKPAWSVSLAGGGSRMVDATTGETR